MTKYLPFILLLLLIICGGSFAQADQPPSYLLFHNEAQVRLDSLNLNSSDANFLERIILMHNIAIHNKNGEAREQAEKFLKNNFKKDTTATVLMYKGLLQMLKIRDRGKAGNGLRKVGGFFGFSDDPYEEAYKAYDDIKLAVQKDSTSIQLRLLKLTVAVESSEYLDGLLKDAYKDLLWLQSRTNHLDSAETFFYALSWAKYAYKYAIIKDHKEEAKKGIKWITFAEKFAITEDYRNEAHVWRLKIDSLQTK